VSEILDSVPHLVWIEKLPDENDSPHDVADGAALRGIEDDAGMLDSRGLKPEKVGILRDDDPPPGFGIGMLVLIGRM
jgi:hypothetical protein